MSVNRDYLPFKSARQYQDRKMAKWMGFFLSEHTSALGELEETFDFGTALPFSERIYLLSQLFANQQKAAFVVRQPKLVQTIKGTIIQFIDSKIGIASDSGYHFIAIEDVLSIKLIQEEDFYDEP